MASTSEDLKKRISEAMEELGKEQQELDDILGFIGRINDADLEQMSGSASSARNKRNKEKARSAAEVKEEHERRRAEKEANIGRMWEKIHDLQEQERKLKANT
jgi:Asp-tRNA(Asn)/Glu-tRNA(Gln) amidotransferase C subunit